MTNLSPNAHRVKSDIIDGIIVAEGGYVNDPDDHGGPTRYGVTQVVWTNFRGTYPDHLEWPIDVKSISRDMAKAYYEHRFAFAEMYRLPCPVWNAVFDFEVNAGRNSIEAIQEMVNDEFLHGSAKRIVADGILGPETEKRAWEYHNDHGTRHFLFQYTARRMAYYLTLCENHERYMKFLAGWLNRSRKNLDHSIVLCAAHNLGLPE